MVKQAILTLAMGISMAMAATQASAAEILVPTGQPTISAAITAASPGDTIRITSAGPFVENITVNKLVNIVVDPGVDAVINGAATGTFIITTVAGAEGSKIGSGDGGRLVISNTGTANRANAIAINHVSGLVTFENIMIENGTSGTARAIQILNTGSTAWKYIEAIGTNSGFEVIRTLPDTTSHTIENSRFVAIRSRSPVYLRSSASPAINAATFTFREVELHSNSSLAPTAGREAISIYGGVAGSVTFDRCWVRVDATTWMTIEHRQRDGGYPLAFPVVNYTNSILEHNGAVSRVMNVRASGMSSGVTINIDRCDFYQTGGTTSTAILMGNLPTALNQDARTMNISNSNFLNADGGALRGVDHATTGTPDVYNITNCNAFSTGNQDQTNEKAFHVIRVVQDGATTYTAFVPLAATNNVLPGRNPGYLDVAVGDYRYSDTFLQTAGTGGQPIGSMMNFAQVPVPVELSTFSLQ